MQKLALIKLGGSVVTFKDKPLTANTVAIDGISCVLAQLNVPAIIVHGGGSFGHYWSVKYDMHTKPADYDPHGVSVVHESMIALNQTIVNSMIRAGLNSYGIPPSVFTTGHKPVAAKIKQIDIMARSKLMPVTFGDVVHMQGTKYSILSGDTLMTILAKALRPS
ncbi:MAG: gamma-glutamyl kinase, partial [Thermoproteota archaeon]